MPETNNIHWSRKCARAKTTNRFRSNLREVDRSNNSGLTNTEPSDEATSVDLTKSTAIRQEYDDTKDPENTQLSSSPQSTYAITQDECPESISTN